jgi:hypothetical protein
VSGHGTVCGGVLGGVTERWSRGNRVEEMVMGGTGGGEVWWCGGRGRGRGRGSQRLIGVGGQDWTVRGQCDPPILACAIVEKKDAE